VVTWNTGCDNIRSYAGVLVRDPSRLERLSTCLFTPILLLVPLVITADDSNDISTTTNGILLLWMECIIVMF